jgi:enoyl-[acyl-carrier-protein] reductase (NADH)
VDWRGNSSQINEKKKKASIIFFKVISEKNNGRLVNNQAASGLITTLISKCICSKYRKIVKIKQNISTKKINFNDHAFGKCAAYLIVELFAFQ